MKSTMIKSAALLLLVSAGIVFAQDETVITPATEAAENLDLEAVAELFKDAEDLEAFEQALNDPETGINNLDLDENGEVDFIRVIEEVADETHVIILQVPLGEDEFQDVATIEIEKTGEESVDMQVHGNEDLYGPDYYVTPTVVHVHSWPIIKRIYGPGYRPYRSRYYWGTYPRWWKPRRPVTVTVYRTRVVKYRPKTVFVVTKKPRVTTVHKVKYTPRRSKRARVVVRPGPRRAGTRRPRRK